MLQLRNLLKWKLWSILKPECTFHLLNGNMTLCKLLKMSGTHGEGDTTIAFPHRINRVCIWGCFINAMQLIVFLWTYNCTFFTCHALNFELISQTLGLLDFLPHATLYGQLVGWGYHFLSPSHSSTPLPAACLPGRWRWQSSPTAGPCVPQIPNLQLWTQTWGRLRPPHPTASRLVEKGSLATFQQGQFRSKKRQEWVERRALRDKRGCKFW